jgi:hypothetical protein
MAEKTYPIIAPDGTKFNITGPDNASKEDIGKAAAAAYEKIKARVTTPAVNLTSQDVTNPTIKPTIDLTAKDTTNPVYTGSLPGHATGISSQDTNAKGLVAEALQRLLPADTYNHPLIQSLINKTPESQSEVAPLARDIISGGAGALAIGAFPEVTLPATLVGSAVMATVDQYLRHASGEGTGSSTFPHNPLYAGIEQTGLNELAGRVIGVAGKALAPGDLIDRVPGVTDELKNLNPTYSQYEASPKHSSLIEDYFGRGAKEASIADSTKRAKIRSNELIADLTIPNVSGPVSSISNDARAELMMAENRASYDKFVATSNKEAQNAVAGADLYPKQLPGTVVQTPIQVPVMSGGIQTGTQTVNASSVVAGKVVNGPIDLNRTLPELLKIRSEMYPNGIITPDVNTPVSRTINDIFKAIDAKFDPQGNLISSNPLGFKEAWDAKQAIDALGYGHLTENINAVDGRFRRISNSLNKDIDESIPKWSNDPSQAPQLASINQSWQQSKAIVQKRHELWGPIGETGKSADTLLNTENAPREVMDSILGDYKKMGRFLESGEATVNGQTVTSTNGRKDLQGYFFKKLEQDNWTPYSPENRDVGVLNGDQYATDYNKFRQSTEGIKLLGTLNSAKARRWDDFVDAVQKTTNQLNNNNNYIKFRFGTATLGLAGELLAEHSDSAMLTRGAIVSGYIGMGVVARIMSNDNYAPILLGLLHGRPLGMSFQAASRLLVQGMSGGHITLTLKDGSKQEAVVGTDGKIRPVK